MRERRLVTVVEPARYLPPVATFGCGSGRRCGLALLPNNLHASTGGMKIRSTASLELTEHIEDPALSANAEVELDVAIHRASQQVPRNMTAAR